MKYLKSPMFKVPVSCTSALAAVLICVAAPQGAEAQTSYSGSYSNVWTTDSGTFVPSSPYNFAQYSFGGNTANGQVSGRLLTTDGTLTGTAQSLNVGQTFLINVGGQDSSGRDGIPAGGRIGFALYSGTDIFNGGASNALGRVQSDSLLRVEFVGGNANTSIVGASTDSGPNFTDFKNGEYYRVSVLSDKQFTISYGDTDATSEFTYNMSDLAGSGGTIQRLNVYNLGANMDALFGQIVVSNAPYLNFSNNAAESKNITGIVSNNGATTNNVVKNGAGTVTFSAANTYTGSTTISNGVLALGGASGALASATSVSVSSGATFDLGGRNQTIAGLSGEGTVTNTSSFALTVNTTTNSTFGGVIAGAGDLTKSGVGTLTLTNNNTYTGGTTISAGTLNLSGGSLASTNYSVASTATLLISTSNEVLDTAAVTLSGGTIARAGGVSEKFGALDLTAASTLNYVGGAAGTLEFGVYEGGTTPSHVLTINNFALGNVLKFGSNLTGFIPLGYTAGGSFNNSNFSINGMDAGAFGGFTSAWNGTDTFTITSVPEPSTVLAAIGLAGMLLWPARRRLVRDAKSILGLRAPMRDRLASRHDHA